MKLLGPINDSLITVFDFISDSSAITQFSIDVKLSTMFFSKRTDESMSADLTCEFGQIVESLTVVFGPKILFSPTTVFPSITVPALISAPLSITALPVISTLSWTFAFSSICVSSISNSLFDLVGLPEFL